LINKRFDKQDTNEPIRDDDAINPIVDEPEVQFDPDIMLGEDSIDEDDIMLGEDSIDEDEMPILIDD
jgi:hypothetical protein